MNGNNLDINPLNGLKEYKIILASASPRRKELLSLLDIPFEVKKSNDTDEIYPSDLTVEQIPEYLALKKAELFTENMKADELYITADTLVIIDGKPIGKPTNELGAKEMLRLLSGRTHKVITGVAITTIAHRISFSALSKVSFDVLDDSEIDYYISKYRPFDKAGSYGIQEWIGGVAIKSIEGSFYNVMGLPLHQLFVELKHFIR